MSKNIVARKVISAPEAGITLTLLELSKEAQEGLNTQGAHIPPAMAPSQMLSNRSAHGEPKAGKALRKRVC